MSLSDFEKYIKEEKPFGIQEKDTIAALKILELKLVEKTNNKAVIGLIISKSGQIKTTLMDVKRSVKLIEGFEKNSQANLENLDAVLNEPIQSAEKNQLSNDEALEQFYSADPGQTQQIGRSQIDPPNCDHTFDYNATEDNYICNKCVKKKASFVDDRYIKLVEILCRVGS